VDDRMTRFANLSILETIAVGDRMFVFAAGRDGGITLFELLRDGRLVFFNQWISSQNMNLSNIEKLDISIMNNDLSVVIHSSTSSQSRVFSIDISSLIGANPRDQIIYSTGHAIGGDGHDLLVDSDGSDVLAGGEGGDVFVLSADQTDDVILDFDPTQDKLDLSFWAMLYARDQLDIIPQDDGVQIVFGDERLSITFDPKSTLTMLTDRNFVFSAHYDMEFTGTNPIHVEIDPDPLGIDVVMAHSAGAFTFPLATDDEPPIAPQTPVISVDWPMSYSDTIVQMFSQNGAHRPTPTTPQPRITFIGGDGIDLRVGGRGADNMLGLGGDDQLYGRTGNDILQGGDGNDQLFGGEGADTIVGGAGHDYLYGGAGADRFVFFPVTTGDLDLIADFDLGQDKIQFHHAKNFDLSQMSNLVMHDVVGGVWIDVWGSVIQLRDVHSWDLTDAHFEFLA
ncbi:hypothetical protein N9A67_05125, partial [Rhodobacteraceae bacterium]|nr:hypothetical protein [Paracoccaceae bacterium]